MRPSPIHLFSNLNWHSEPQCRAPHGFCSRKLRVSADVLKKTSIKKVCNLGGLISNEIYYRTSVYASHKAHSIFITKTN